MAVQLYNSLHGAESEQKKVAKKVLAKEKQKEKSEKFEYVKSSSLPRTWVRKKINSHENA